MGIYGDLRHDNLKNIWFSDNARIIRDRIKKCNAHCLQDCIYFPSNILGKAKEFFRKMERFENDKAAVKSRFLEKIEYYISILSGENAPYPYDNLNGDNFRNEIDNLIVIRKGLMKIS
jgi:hypothetical protein